MRREGMEEEVSGQVSRRDIGSLWFLGGCALSITTLASVVLLLLLLVSLSLNIYLLWTMSGYKVAIAVSRPTPALSPQPSREIGKGGPTPLNTQPPPGTATPA